MSEIAGLQETHALHTALPEIRRPQKRSDHSNEAFSVIINTDLVHRRHDNR
jgi:hypothetical protein